MMLSIPVLLFLVATVSQLSAKEYTLVWEDNFDFLNLSNWQHEVTAWGGGNHEFQTYTNDPALSYTRDGKLFIQPKMTADCINPLTGQPFGDTFLFEGILDLWKMYGTCTFNENNGCYRNGKEFIIPPAMSARLRSYQRFSFKYGRVEIRAKMPSGDWLWPAMWMLPEDWSYGGWPNSGEIDIVEVRGNRDFYCGHVSQRYGIDKMSTALHWGLNPSNNRFSLTCASRENKENNYADHFHNYTMVWDENGVRMILDEEELASFPDPPINENSGWQSFYEFGKPWHGDQTNIWANGDDPKVAPFDKKFHFLLNVAVGGRSDFIPDGCTNRGGGQYNKPWSNSNPYAPYDFWGSQDAWLWTWNEYGTAAALEVDYIRVWQEV